MIVYLLVLDSYIIVCPLYQYVVHLTTFSYYHIQSFHLQILSFPLLNQNRLFLFGHLMKRIYLMAKIKQFIINNLIINLVQKYKIREVDLNFLSEILFTYKKFKEIFETVKPFGFIRIRQLLFI